MPSPLEILSALLSVTSQTDPNKLTPRQKQGLAGGEACNASLSVG